MTLRKVGHRDENMNKSMDVYKLNGQVSYLRQHMILKDEDQSSDVATLRGTTRVLEEHLCHHGDSTFEPNVVKKPRGRPQKNHPSA